DGNLWFTDGVANKIGRITTTGAVTEFAIPTAACYPTGIGTGTDGNIWILENAVGKIGRITPSGIITEFLIPGAPAPNSYYYITHAPAPDGNLWFVGSQVGRVTPSGVITLFAIPPTISSQGITVGPDGNLWF